MKDNSNGFGGPVDGWRIELPDGRIAPVLVTESTMLWMPLFTARVTFVSLNGSSNSFDASHNTGSLAIRFLFERLVRGGNRVWLLAPGELSRAELAAQKVSS